MRIETERLTLVPLGTVHFDTTLIYSTDPDNTRMMCFLPCDNGEEVMDYLVKCEKQWKMEKPEYLDAAVLLNGQHIGAVSIELLEEGTVGEFGWIIHKAHWGRGYAAEAALALMQYMTEHFGIRHYIAHCDTENAASVRVMEKLGMTLAQTISGRKNRNCDELRKEYLFELFL